MSKKSCLIATIFLIFSSDAICKTLPVEAENMLSASYSGNPDKYHEIGEEEAAMRLNAVSVEAYSWGIREGAFYRNDQIQQLLQSRSFTINKTVSLSKFIIDGKMLMPTVLEAERIYVKSSDREARTVNMSYTLDKPPRIVSQVPTWRDYLLRTMAKPIKPIDNAYPRNDVEIQVWAREFKRGWFRGVEQANSIFESDLNKLHSDVAGLYRFRFLLAQNIVTLPKLIKNKSSVMLLDSGKTINLNDVKYSIQLDSRFNKVTDWKPVFNKGNAHE
ncbi:type IV secretory system conjugative DNA transfer family protein [Pseudoalteromonas prydzensis]|uniref:type IV secretory system conjugative DNA transfer family protein n=1 Tax=Pseudoalteromonas prydzensis TaxID=182141 RepID=UPI003FCFA3D9